MSCLICASFEVLGWKDVLLCLGRIIFWVGKKKILWRVKLPLNCLTIFYFGMDFVKWGRSRKVSASCSPAPLVVVASLERGDFPAAEESRREYPLESMITWHRLNFLFLNLLRHFLKSKRNIATTTKRPFFLLQLNTRDNCEAAKSYFPSGSGWNLILLLLHWYTWREGRCPFHPPLLQVSDTRSTYISLGVLP